jgi:hypothetical protein
LEKDLHIPPLDAFCMFFTLDQWDSLERGGWRFEDLMMFPIAVVFHETTSGAYLKLVVRWRMTGRKKRGEGTGNKGRVITCFDSAECSYQRNFIL